MSDIFASPTAQAGAAVVVLCVLIAVAFYLVSRFRDYAAQDQESTTEALFKLEEMHRRGDISDQEFRTIKARTHQQPDANDSGDDPPLAESSSSDSPI